MRLLISVCLGSSFFDMRICICVLRSSFSYQPSLYLSRSEDVCLPRLF